MSSSRQFWFDRDLYDPSTPEGQGALMVARRDKKQISCACCPAQPELYVASLADRFIIKRMPGTGHKHAPDCPSYAPPDELSGYGQVLGEAINEDFDTGETVLRLDFALTKSGTRAAPPEATPGVKSEVAADPRKLRLSALLHYLWQEAGLVKWVPGMAGKRSWGLVRHRLLDAVSGKRAKSRDLGEVLFVPEVWRKDINAEIAARRVARFAALQGGKPRSARQLGLLIGEYKSHRPARFGSKLIVKHMPDAPFFMDEALARRFDDAFGGTLMLSEMIPGAHIILIGTFGVADKGYATLVEVGLMLVNADWLPIEHIRDHALVERLTTDRRSFIKSLRFNLKPGSPIASAVLTDLPKPIALFVSDPNSDASAISELHLTAAEGVYPAWIWGDEIDMPALPTGAREMM